MNKHIRSFKSLYLDCYKNGNVKGNQMLISTNNESTVCKEKFIDGKAHNRELITTKRRDEYKSKVEYAK